MNTSYLKRIALASQALLMTFAISGAHAAPPVNDTLKVVSFNILAPCWADPTLYPAGAGVYLDRTYRQGKIINYLKSRSTADIITLQEVNTPEFNAINNALKKNYVGFQSFHSPTYWSQWITVNPPWEPNGNAVFLKKSKFTNIVFSDVALSTTGNHASLVTAKHTATNKNIRAVSLHLDSDRPQNRDREFKALLALMPPLANTTDIVAGDFNIDINNTGLQNDVTSAGFTNVLGSLGIDEPTSPYSSTYYGHTPFGALDFILARKATPIDGAIISNGLYITFPDLQDDEARIIEHMKITGSDHFAVEGTVKINP